MKQDSKTLVLLDGSNPQLAELLDWKTIVQELKSMKDVKLVELSSGGAAKAISSLEASCKKASPKGIVVCGDAAILEALPDVIECGDSETAHRLSRVNLLERCALLHTDAAKATKLAIRQIQIAVTGASAAKPLNFVERKMNRNVVVLGYGEAGLLAAEALTDQGFSPIMIAAPDKAYPGARIPEGAELLRDVEIDSIEGNVGAFRLTLKENGERKDLTAGAVCVAARPQLTPLRVTEELSLSGRVAALSAWSLQLDEMPTPQRICIWMDHQGQEARSVAYSTFCAVEKAQELGYDVTILFKNMPVYGISGQMRYDRIRHAGATIIRYDELPALTLGEDGIRFDVRDMVLPEDTISFEVDRLIIPEKVLPSKMNRPLAKMLHQPLDDDGFFQPCNVRHLPVGSPRRGVYYVGSAHRDVDPEEAASEAQAAAAEIASILANETIRVPHELVTVDKTICASCLTCLRSCQHGAIRVDPSQRSVQFIEEACWECGVCAAVCPRKAITRSSFSESQLSEVISRAVAELDGQRPRVVFCCRNSASEALESAGNLGIAIPDDIVFVEVPCAGHLSENEIVKTLVRGAGSVEVFGCHHDNCRSEIGSKSAHRRSEEVRRSLVALGLDPEAVRYHTIAANEPYRMAHILWEKASGDKRENETSIGGQVNG